MRTFFCSFMLLTGLLNLNSVSAQNFIGMDKQQIIQEMRTSHKKFKLNTDDVNPHYKYLKFENKIDEITILYFLSEDDKCTLIRKMCDYSNINEAIAELNSTCKKAGKNSWTYSDKGKTYQVSLAEEEWYFTITTKLKK